MGARPQNCDLATCEQALRDYLNKTAIAEKPSAGADLVCWETQGDQAPIRLSFAIKVF